MIIDDNGKIISNLRSDIMRYSIENKNLLRSLGSLYIGTGTQKQIQTLEGVVKIPKTTSLSLGNENNFLIAIPSTGELQYQKLSADMLDNTMVYNITCKNALYTDYVEEATEAEYATLGQASGTIENRLIDAESDKYGQCIITYPTSHSSIYKEGHVVQNQLLKKGGGVTMKLSIYDCCLSQDTNGRYDYIDIQLPQKFRPSQDNNIIVSLSTYINYESTYRPPWSGTTYTITGESARFMVSCDKIIGSGGFLRISFENLKNSVQGDTFRVHKCTAIEINAGWNIYNE